MTGYLYYFTKILGVFIVCSYVRKNNREHSTFSLYSTISSGYELKSVTKKDKTIIMSNKDIIKWWEHNKPIPMKKCCKLK